MILQNINSSNNIYFQAKENSLVNRYALDTYLGLGDRVTDCYTGRRRKSYQAIESYKAGEISKEELNKQLERRYNARKESSELISDLIVSTASFTMFKNIAKFSSVTELFKKDRKSVV